MIIQLASVVILCRLVVNSARNCALLNFLTLCRTTDNREVILFRTDIVNALTANLQLYVGDQIVADPVEPAEHGTRTIRRLELYLRESGLQVNAVDQITIALDRARYLLAEVRGTIEGVLNGLHCEVSVTTIYNLEDKFGTLPFGIFNIVRLFIRDWTLS